MKTVALVWTPSASPGEDAQAVRIFNAETLETYGEETLSPQANRMTAICPEGIVVQGSVTTRRGEESVTSISDILEIGYGPLMAASGLTIGVIEPAQLPS